MLSLISNVGIRGRLLAGLGLICFRLAAAVGYTAYAMSDINARFKKVAELRVPVSIASTQLVADLYSTLTTLRGYLLSSDAQEKQNRAAMWVELDRTAETFDRKAAMFARQDKGMWTEAKALIAEFGDVLAKAEAAAFTPKAYPASELLTNEAGPLIAAMFGDVTKMINEEEQLEASSERKHLLKTLTDIRGNLAASGSQLRLYVASGEQADREKFGAPYANFKAALASAKTLTPSQKAANEAIVKAS
jgi:methyl-accepting chemotaxis protein